MVTASAPASRSLPAALARAAIFLGGVAPATRAATNAGPNTAVAPAPAPLISLTILGPGNTSSNPSFGAKIRLAVECTGGDGACPSWVRIDRTDGVADTAPFVRVVDESMSGSWAPRFPTWFKPAWGPQWFSFGGSVDNNPIPIVASGWTDRYNGTRLTPNSSAATIVFSTAYERSAWDLGVESLGPGTARLTIAPATTGDSTDQALTMWGHVQFDRFVRNGNLTASPPQFVSSFVYHEVSATGTIVVAFQQPGVYFYGATTMWHGRAGRCTAGGEYDGRPSTRPAALVVAGPDGNTGNQTIPAGFAGTVHRLPALPTPHRFCIVDPNVTLFAGAQLKIPLCRPDPKVEIASQPGFVSVIAPSWLKLHPRNNASTRSSADSATLNSTKALPGGLTRSTFATASRKSPRWSTYNNYAPLYTTFPAENAGTRARPLPPVALQVLIHADPADADTLPVEAWQRLLARAVVTPALAAVPQRLVTSYTWADSSLLYDPPTPSPAQPSAFLELYRGLGFNTVPAVSLPAQFKPWTASNTTVAPKPGAPPELTPAGRRGVPGWEGLLFGPEVSAPDPSGGASNCKRYAPNASMLPPGLSAAETKLELAKWSNAHDYFLATGNLDVAYDGIFARQNNEHFCALMATTQPDWVFLDDESFGEGWVPWANTVTSSANAVARRLPGESRTNLAWRMAVELLSGFTGCLATVSPSTNVGWYADPFPDQIFASAGISMQPSLYSTIRDLQDHVHTVRHARQSQGAMASGKTRHLLPWLTAGTYGQMTAVATWEGVLHTFGGGATGFSFFLASLHSLDDPAKLLALSTAIALAMPFEDHLVDGTPMIDTEVAVVAGQLRAWSGMRLGASRWVVLTPGGMHRTAPSEVTIEVALDATMDAAVTYGACDLTTGTIVPTTMAAAGGGVRVQAALSRTTVLHIAPTGSSSRFFRPCSQSALPPDAWLPAPWE